MVIKFNDLPPEAFSIIYNFLPVKDFSKCLLLNNECNLKSKTTEIYEKYYIKAFQYKKQHIEYFLTNEFLRSRNFLGLITDCCSDSISYSLSGVVHPMISRPLMNEWTVSGICMGLIKGLQTSIYSKVIEIPNPIFRFNLEPDYNGMIGTIMGMQLASIAASVIAISPNKDTLISKIALGILASLPPLLLHTEGNWVPVITAVIGALMIKQKYDGQYTKPLRDREILPYQLAIQRFDKGFRIAVLNFCVNSPFSAVSYFGFLHFPKVSYGPTTGEGFYMRFVNGFPLEVPFSPLAHYLVENQTVRKYAWKTSLLASSITRKITGFIEDLKMLSL